MTKQFKKEIVKNFFFQLEQKDIINLNIYKILNFFKLYNYYIINSFDSLNYVEQKNIFNSLYILFNQELNTNSNTKETLVTIINIIKLFKNKNFNKFIISKINFNKYYENYFFIIYYFYKENLLELSLEEYINLFNNKFNSFTKHIKEEFFILFLEKITIEYNKDKKIGYTRINWNDIFNDDFKEKFLITLISIWNTSDKQENITNILILLNDFIYIYMNVFEKLLSKIQFYNIKFNIDYRIDLTKFLNKNLNKLDLYLQYNIEDILKDNNIDININYYIVLYLLNLLTYNIKTEKDYLNFKKEIYSLNLDLNILEKNLPLNLPLINYNNNYELLYLIYLGAENKLLNTQNSIDRLLYLLDKNKDCNLFILKNKKIKDNLPKDFELWKNNKILKQLKLFFNNYNIDIKQQNYYLTIYYENLYKLKEE